jgi:hypothetical protein
VEVAKNLSGRLQGLGAGFTLSATAVLFRGQHVPRLLMLSYIRHYECCFSIPLHLQPEQTNIVVALSHNHGESMEPNISPRSAVHREESP